MKHSFAQNVIERAFGLLKDRWAILCEKSYYSVQVHCRTIIVCCLQHNLINRKVTNVNILDDIDEGGSNYATTGEGWRSDNETFRPGYLAQWVRITRGEDAKIQFNIDCYYLNKSEGVQPKDRLGMEFPTMYCPKMNMSPEDMMGHSTW
ncbi:retrotransposon protein [Cucumis melo var. makuwa]|uniref:Retrotransposon protein n=1 Tax=Cucumis melo var. makuwa TaxID=1194695 RepID=A0A5A7T331_CUCMM|nr:retrotransposon protein [Cucumis melo var. makuwa]